MLNELNHILGNMKLTGYIPLKSLRSVWAQHCKYPEATETLRDETKQFIFNLVAIYENYQMNPLQAPTTFMIDTNQ